MAFYIIYSKATGDIVKVLQCPRELVKLNYDHETEDYLEHHAPIDDRLYKVKNRKLVEIKNY